MFSLFKENRAFGDDSWWRWWRSIREENAVRKIVLEIYFPSLGAKILENMTEKVAGQKLPRKNPL